MFFVKLSSVKFKEKERERVPEIAQNRQNCQNLINIHCTFRNSFSHVFFKKMFSKILLNSRPIGLSFQYNKNSSSSFLLGIIHLERAPNFSKKLYFLPTNTHTYVCVWGGGGGVRNVSCSENFAYVLNG